MAVTILTFIKDRQLSDNFRLLVDFENEEMAVVAALDADMYKLNF